MIVGVGIDVVDVERFTAKLGATPRLLERLFAVQERDLPPTSLAGRFAAKEALAKALGAPVGLHWTDAVVVKDEIGKPSWELAGSVAARAEALGIRSMHLSISHDAGIASAVVVAES
ncbi:holo-[acyl-carrier-protein] synthase [Flexivirga endophytica]|uniref:Holo-[acyl-carrier-protein] synthase n=1 Tax=Flexivirga endophytica TaxID=1849103 RepID=A0A916TJ26_9MICO|nr:holo-ACP synthase [Flexivirga endophytica]GGB46961.1 holo-[acyl-carrier-protein] synthase [Flexivirga endophytica]GHB67581.1 holo-[acyl-carrier-protein] synthase [Flexivirga endophytica]